MATLGGRESAKKKSPSNFPTMYFHVSENENAEEIHLEITDQDEHGGGILRILTTPELAEKIRAHDGPTLNEILGIKPSQNESTISTKSTVPNMLITQRSTTPTMSTAPTCTTSTIQRSPTPTTSTPRSWSKSAEQNLLNLYKEVENSRKPAKAKWLFISKELQSIDPSYEYTAEQCRLKIKSLKERHGKLKRKLEKSGSDNPNDPLEEDMEDTFAKQPDVSPIYTTDSEKATSNDESASDVDPCKKMKYGRPRVTRKKAETGKDLLLQEIQKSNEDAERRHQERLELQRNFIDVLKDAFQSIKK